MTTEKGLNEIYEGDVQYSYADVGTTELLHISHVNQE